MLERIKALLKLQAVDKEIRDINHAASSYPARLKEIDDDLGADRAASDEKQAELDEIEAQRKLIESQIQAQKDQIRKWESRLTDIKTPREYAAMSREIDIAKKSIRNQEEEILNLMEQAESLNKEIELIERTIFEKEKGYESERKELRAKLSSIEKDRSELEARRKNLSEDLEARLLSVYERILARKGGIAMAAVGPGGACEVCRMRIPPQLCNDLMTGAGDRIIQCPSCYRILYIPEPPEDDDGEEAHDAGAART